METLKINVCEIVMMQPEKLEVSYPLNIYSPYFVFVSNPITGVDQNLARAPENVLWCSLFTLPLKVAF